MRACRFTNGVCALLDQERFRAENQVASVKPLLQTAGQRVGCYPQATMPRSERLNKIFVLQAPLRDIQRNTVESTKNSSGDLCPHRFLQRLFLLLFLQKIDT